MAGTLKVDEIYSSTGTISIPPGHGLDLSDCQSSLILPRGTELQQGTPESSGMRFDLDSGEFKSYGQSWNRFKNKTYSNIIESNLLINYDPSNINSFPNLQSPKLYNLKGSQNSGTISNATYSSFGGGSMFYDGNSSITGGSVFVGDQYTIEFVFYSTAVENYRNPVDMNYTTYSGISGNVGPRFEQYSSYAGLTNAGVWIWSGVTTANDPYNLSTYFSISPNTWYHMAFVMDNGSVTTYQNNVQIGSAVSSPNGYVTTFGDVRLGRGFVLDPGRWFKGNIAIFRLYRRNLSADELTVNFNYTKDRFGI